MKSPEWYRNAHLLSVYCLCALQVSSVQAQESDSSSNGSVLGIAVGVSVATSLLTTLLTLLIAYLVLKHSRRKKKPHVERGEPVRNSNTSRYSDASTKPLFKRSESQETTLPSCNGDARYRSSTRQAIQNVRIKTDYTSKWCTDNELTEATAQCMRERGFTTRAAIEALRAQDIAKLELKTIAEECKLREVLNRRLKTDSQTSMNRQRSTSEENIPSPSYRDTDTSGGSSMFERSNSYHQMDSVDGALPIGKPLRPGARKKSMGSMEIVETDEGGVVVYNNGLGERGRMIHTALVTPATVVTPRDRSVRSFNGLLSDTGLWQLANMIGAEWSHLAAVLRIPKSKQEQLQLNYPNNSMMQINEMLRLWRDTTAGNKQQVKSKLHEAFCKVRRNDLADYILEETTHGSEERVTCHSIV